MEKAVKPPRHYAFGRNVRVWAGSVRAFYANGLPPSGSRAKRFFSSNRFEISIFLLFFLINLLYTLGMQYPILTDEHVTMAEGIFLWGADHWAFAYEGANYYGYGYSILYGFLYGLTQDMRVVFQLSLALNSVVISFIPLLCYRMCRLSLGLRQAVSLLISLAVGLYPAAVLYSKYALNETVMLLLPWLAAYILLHLKGRPACFKKTLALYAALGLVSMYAYTVHGRGAAVLGVSFILILFFAFWNRKKEYIWYILAFLLAAGLYYLVDGAVKSYLLSDFFRAGAGEAGNTVERVLSVNMANAFSPQNLGKMFSGFWGQALYMMLTTFGLLSPGCAALAGILRRIRKAAAERQSNLNFLFVFTALFALVSILISTAFLSGIYVSDELLRTEYYMYGRYNEAACMMVVFVVVAFFAVRKKLSPRLTTCSFALFFAVAVSGVILVARKVTEAGGSLSYSMVPGVMPFMGFEAWTGAGYANFIPLLIIVPAIFTALFLLLKKGKRLTALVILICCFIYSFNYSMFAYIYPTSEKRYTTAEPFGIFARDIADLAGQYPRVYVDFFSAPIQGVQFALPEFEVRFLEIAEYGYGRLSGIEENSLVISKHDTIKDEVFGDIYEVGANKGAHVWVYGEELRAELEQRGYTTYRQKAKRSSKYAGSELQIGADGRVEGSAALLEPGGLQFGPYTGVFPGEYTVDIYGSGLDNADYYIKNDGGAVFYRVPEFEAFSSEHVFYRFTVNSFAETMEFQTHNTGNGQVRVDSLALDLTGGIERPGAADAGVFTDLSRNYGLKDSGLYRGGNLSFTGGSVKGQTGLLLREGGRMSLGSLYANPGRHAVRVYGENISAAGISFEAEYAVSVSDFREYGDSVVFTLETNDYIREGRLTLANGGGEETIFRGVVFNVLELTELPGAIVWERGI